MQELRRVRSGVLGEKVGIFSCHTQSVEFRPTAQCGSANETLEQKPAADAQIT